MTHLSERDRVIGTIIVDSIDEDGYLRANTEELLAALEDDLEELELDEIEAVLRMVQHFEPSGVGARDLRECLLIQLRQLDAETPLREDALDLVDSCFDILAARDFKQLMRLKRWSREFLSEVLNLVQALNPRPGASSHPQPSEYVTPDVVVTKRKDRWVVMLNQEAMPRVRVNPEYARLVRRADDSADNTSMRSHLQKRVGSSKASKAAARRSSRWRTVSSTGKEISLSTARKR